MTLDPTHLPRYIRLAFSHDAEPGKPLPLCKESLDKLDNVPRLLRALANCSGAKLGIPELWGGAINVPFSSDPELFDSSISLASDLAVTAAEIHENSRRQPPLPLNQAVSHPYCLEILRALAQTHEKSKLTASMNAGGTTVELPQVPLACFTEPDKDISDVRQLRSKVLAVCAPKADANVLVLTDMSLLELPFAHYPYDLDEIFGSFVKQPAVFFGQAEVIGKHVYRALACGKLQSQLAF